MHKGTLRVHQIKLVIDAREDLRDGRGVADHAHSAHDLREVTARHDCWWLIVDTALEASGTPIDELDGALGIDRSHGSVDILWHDIAAVHEAASHVLSVTWVALHVHSRRLEHRHSDLRHGELLVVSLLG